eukprot:scaffold96243_cov13-Tisochrysis_lutea.AAC.1
MPGSALPHTCQGTVTKVLVQRAQTLSQPQRQAAKTIMPDSARLTPAASWKQEVDPKDSNYMASTATNAFRAVDNMEA